MIDFNATEVIILVGLAVIIFGPEKLPDLARKIARVFSYLRQIANDTKGQLKEQLGPEFADLHLADLDPRQLGRTLIEPEVQAVSGPVRSAAVAAAEATAAHPGALAPPDAAEPSPGSPADSGSVVEGVPQRQLTPFDPEAT